LTAIQSLQRELKRQRRKIESLGGDSDQGAPTMDASIVIPSLEEMSKLDLEAQFDLQERVLNALEKASEHGSMIVHELSLKARVKTQASQILGLLNELEDQPGHIEYLKSGNGQALVHRSSTLDPNIIIPSLEEMSKLHPEAQFELQEGVINAMKRALEPGWAKIKRVNRQNLHIQRTEDAAFAMSILERWCNHSTQRIVMAAVLRGLRTCGILPG
jgi:hypothetical protein